MNHWWYVGWGLCSLAPHFIIPLMHASHTSAINLLQQGNIKMQIVCKKDRCVLLAADFTLAHFFWGLDALSTAKAGNPHFLCSCTFRSGHHQWLKILHLAKPSLLLLTIVPVSFHYIDAFLLNVMTSTSSA